MGRFGECLRGVTPLDVHVLADVSRCLAAIRKPAECAFAVVGVVNKRRILRQRGVDTQDSGQFIVFDVNQLERLFSGQLVFGHHGGYGLAHEPDLTDGEQRVILYGMAIVWIDARQIRAS